MLESLVTSAVEWMCMGLSLQVGGDLETAC